eukprot:PITA_35075
MSSNSKIETKKFNGQIFELWKLKMENLLVEKDQWIMVYPCTKPMKMPDEDWKKLDQKAKSTIELRILDSIFLNVSREASMKALRDKLGTLYQYKSLVNKLLLRKHLSKVPEKEKGFDDAPSAEVKTTLDEGGDVYLSSSSSTHVYHEAWLIDSGASFHFNRHREWFCEYEKYDGGDVFLGDDRKARIIGNIKFKLNLQGGRISTLQGVRHIPALARNLISVRKMDDAGVKTMFKKYTCKMVQGVLILMQGVWIGTLYKLLGSTVIDGCNNYVVPESGA